MKNWLLKALNENKSFLIFIILMMVFRSAIADWNTVPTGSMKPTILEGDRILVNKLAYDVQLPFVPISLYKISDPKRGDIIVFDSAVSDLRLVKRVIGIPGDTIKLENNLLTVNGVDLTYEEISPPSMSVRQSEKAVSEEDLLENLLGIEHFVRVNKPGGRLSNFSEVTVPNGYYLAMGDNRDNSTDSRVIGFVPRDEIRGRSQRVVMSLNYENYYIPRSDRFFHTM